MLKSSVTTNSFFCIFLLVVSGTECNRLLWSHFLTDTYQITHYQFHFARPKYFCTGLNPNKGGVMMNNWKNEFFLARGLVLHRHSGGILQFFDALEQVLNQSTLNSLIIALCDILRTEFKVRFKSCKLASFNWRHSFGIP